MKKGLKKKLVISLLITCTAIISCQEQAKDKEPQSDIKLGATIGELSEVFTPEPIEVEGYGLMGGLRGTGSSQCPPQIRRYLQQYILKNLPGKTNISALIDSADTAVVYVCGKIPPIAAKGENFDLKVTALPGTETTSLEGGILWGADLRAKSRFAGTSKVLAKAEGPIYIDKIDSDQKDKSAINPADKRSGFILAGGKVLDDYHVILLIRQKDYKLTSRIRDRINERFGYGIAKATMPGQINLSILTKYKERKQKFISLVRATYLTEDISSTNQRVEQLLKLLETSKDKDSIEISIEATGNISADKVASVLNSADSEVRFRAARYLLNVGDDRGLEILRETAFDITSPFRKAAIEAIGTAARRNDAASILQSLMRDDDFEIRLAAFEQLSRLDDVSITRKLIGRNFYLEETAGTDYKNIYVSRSDRPYIILLGGPMYCVDGSFIQSEDGNITINALPGADKVSLTRKVAGLPPITIESSHKLSDIIESLCEEATVPKDSYRKAGLNIPYSDMAELLKQMCEKGAVPAEFRAGKLVQID